MHIPTVTDEMLQKVLDCAKSPVAVLFFGGDDPNRICLVSNRFARVAEQHDDRVIFLRISGDENPTPYARWTTVYTGVEIVVFRLGRDVARLSVEFTADSIEKLIEIVRAKWCTP